MRKVLPGGARLLLLLTPLTAQVVPVPQRIEVGEGSCGAATLHCTEDTQ